MESGDRKRITVFTITQSKLALVVGTPELVGMAWPGKGGASSFVAPPTAAPDEAVSVEHRVDGYPPEE